MKEKGGEVFGVGVERWKSLGRAEFSLRTATTKTGGFATMINTHLPLNFHLVIYNV